MSILNPRRKGQLTPLLLLSPAFILMAIVIAYPLFQAIRFSFYNISLLMPQNARFNGFTNYVKILHDEAFWRAFVNSLAWIACSVSLQFIVGMAGALLLNNDFFGRAVARAISLIPWATSSVLVALMWTWMFDGNYGVINDILLRIGVIDHYKPWLAQPNTALASIVAANVWQGAPFFAVMLLASMQGIPETLYEAARIDGAGPLTQFAKITIPQIMPTIITTTVLRIIWTANYVDLILVMTRGGPGYASTTLPLFAYLTFYSRLKVGEGAAIAVFQAFFLIISIAVYIRILQRNRTNSGGGL